MVEVEAVAAEEALVASSQDLAPGLLPHHHQVTTSDLICSGSPMKEIKLKSIKMIYFRQTF